MDADREMTCSQYMRQKIGGFLTKDLSGDEDESQIQQAEEDQHLEIVTPPKKSSSGGKTRVQGNATKSKVAKKGKAPANNGRASKAALSLTTIVGTAKASGQSASVKQEAQQTPTPPPMAATSKHRSTVHKNTTLTKTSFRIKMPAPTPATEDDQCFAAPLGDRPKRHATAVDKMYFRRIWIGYAEADKIDEPFRDLPSYSQLLQRSETSSGPFPPLEHGLPTGEKQVECLGCAGIHPEVLTITDRADSAGGKHTIYPMTSPNKEKLFAILVPQPTDPSNPNVQTYHFWECPRDDGKSFKNKVGIIVKNPIEDAGTPVTITQELNNPVSASAAAAAGTHDDGFVANDVSMTDFSVNDVSRNGNMAGGMNPQSQTPSPNSTGNVSAVDTPTKASKRKRSVDNEQADQSPKRHAGPINPTTASPTPTPCGPTVSAASVPTVSGSPVSTGSAANAPVVTATPVSPVSGATVPTVSGSPVSTGSAARVLTVSAATVPTVSPATVPVTLTEEQAGQITFVWTVQVGDTVYECVYSLDEFEERTADGFLAVLKEYAAAVDKEMLKIVLMTKMWRLSFVEKSGARKAYVFKGCQGAVFQRLMGALAGVLNSGGPGENIVVEVQALAG